MKNNYIKNLLIVLSTYICFIKYCNSRELDSPEIILKNLHIFLNTGFEYNQLIILNNKYYFNISFIQPLLIYSNYYFKNDSIYIIEPKLSLYFSSKLYIPFKSKVKYYDRKMEESKSISLSILFEANFSNIIFDKLEDNSYALNYHFNNNNFLNNSKIFFGYIENYSFFDKNDINIEEIKKFFDIYINRIKLYLEDYPEGDGLFLFKKIKDYIIKTRVFDSMIVSLSFYVDRPEVSYLEYERHSKVENIKSMFTKVRVNISYNLCDEFSYMDFCPHFDRYCIIKNITIDKKELYYGEFIMNGNCEGEDAYLIKKIINRSRDFVSSFV